MIHPSFVAPISGFVASLNLDVLCHHANTIRDRVDCNIRKEKFQCGKDHVVFELGFQDKVFWVARFPCPIAGYTVGLEDMRSEIATMDFVRQHSTIPIPKIHGYSLDNENGVGAPYILMDALPGKTITLLPLVDDQHKAHVYRQVASLMLQINRLPRWPKIGMIQRADIGALYISELLLAMPNDHRRPAKSSAKVFFDLRSKCFLDRKIAEGNIDKIAIAWLYREATPYFLQPEMDGQFPLCHADFSNCNILYGDDYNVTGVIDWTWAQSGPWEQFALFPHEFSRRVSAENNVCGEARALFLAILENEERKMDGRTSLANFMKSNAARILELTQEYQHINDGSYLPMDDVHELIQLMYGDTVSWEDVKRMAKADLDIS